MHSEIENVCVFYYCELGNFLVTANSRDRNKNISFIFLLVNRWNIGASLEIKSVWRWSLSVDTGCKNNCFTRQLLFHHLSQQAIHFKSNTTANAYALHWFFWAIPLFRVSCIVELLLFRGKQHIQRYEYCRVACCLFSFPLLWCHTNMFVNTRNPRSVSEWFKRKTKWWVACTRSTQWNYVPSK